MNHVLLTYGTWIALICRILACIVLLYYCIPLQVKEARVKNGLRSLRFQLLTLGTILFFNNFFSLIGLVVVLTSPHAMNSFLQVLNGFASLTAASIIYRIYHSQYSDENKQQHDK